MGERREITQELAGEVIRRWLEITTATGAVGEDPDETGEAITDLNETLGLPDRVVGQMALSFVKFCGHDALDDGEGTAICRGYVAGMTQGVILERLARGEL